MTLFNSILTPAPTDGVHTETSDTQAQTESFLTDLINRHLRQPAFDGTPFVSHLPFALQNIPC